MIPAKLDRKVSGNLQGDRIRMGFAEGAEKHLVSLLTDMYSDPEKACIREYACNARDSHVEARNTAPIEVTTPSPLSPYLTIKDYGVGLSVEDIHEIYSKYGASTKRDSNEVTGMLGIGCKSALTYASQFTVIGIKDGVRTVVAVSRDEDGSNVMTIVDTSATDESNGVEVSIPARAGHTFPNKATEFFSYWQPGTVLINGQPPKQLVVCLELDDRMTLITTDRYTNRASVVVMGNVPYPVEELATQELGIPYGHALVARVPVGTVDFAPSREALYLSKRTKLAIEKLKADFKAEIKLAVERKISTAVTKPEAVAAVNKWSHLLGQNRPPFFRFKGQQLPTSISVPAGNADNRMLVTTTSSYRMGHASQVRSIDTSYMEKAVFVTDYEVEKFTPTHKKKLLLWVEQQKLEGVNSFVLVNFHLDKTWLDPARVVDWPTIKALVLPKVSRAGVTQWRLPGSYDVVTTGSVAKREVAGADLDYTKPVYFIHGNMRNTRWGFAPILDALKMEYSIVCLPANRLAKFQRDNPKVQNVKDVIVDAYNKWFSSLSADEKAALQLHERYEASDLKTLSAYAAELKDPDLKRACKLASKDVTALFTIHRSFAGHGHILADKDTWINPLSKYLLFDRYKLRSHRKHLIAYMNAAYEGGF